jgi:PAS domain-containing protein
MMDRQARDAGISGTPSWDGAPPRPLIPRQIRGWLIAILVTCVAGAVAWQIRAVTGVNLAYASAFVVVGILLNASLARGLFAFAAIGISGLFLMHGKAEVFVLFVIGMATTIAQVVMTARAGERLARLRDHAGRIERLLHRSRRTLNQAGVLVVMLDEEGTWVAANPVALEAFGISTDSVDFSGPTLRISPEAAMTLMSPGSQESWRHLLNTSIASWTGEGQRWSRLALSSIAGATYSYDVLLDRATDGSVMLIGQKRLLE